jgi:hypothetical protein
VGGCSVLISGVHFKIGFKNDPNGRFQIIFHGWIGWEEPLANQDVPAIYPHILLLNLEFPISPTSIIINVRNESHQSRNH